MVSHAILLALSATTVTLSSCFRFRVRPDLPAGGGVRGLLLREEEGSGHWHRGVRVRGGHHGFSATREVADQRARMEGHQHHLRRARTQLRGEC